MALPLHIKIGHLKGGINANFSGRYKHLKESIAKKTIYFPDGLRENLSAMSQQTAMPTKHNVSSHDDRLAVMQYAMFYTSESSVDYVLWSEEMEDCVI